MNAQQRKCGSFTLAQELHCSLFTPTSNEALCGITITCDVFTKKPGYILYHVVVLRAVIIYQ